MKFIENYLQLFAVQTTLLNSLGNDLSPEMKTFYDMTLLDEAQANLVHHQFGQKRPIPANKGKTIEFRRFSSLPKALAPLTEGVTPAGNNLDVTTVTATVHQYGDFISQSDVLELTAIDNTIVEATKILGRQAGVTLDTVVREVLMTGTNVMFVPTVSEGTETVVTTRGKLNKTAVLNVKTIMQAVAKLRAQNAPTIGGDYVAIIHPYAAYDIMRDNEWTDAAKYGAPTQLFEGEIGKIAGVRFVQSTEAKIFKGAPLGTGEMKVNHGAGYTGAITSITFDGTTVTEDELIGRYININGVVAKITDNTTTTITFDSTNFGTIADDDVVYPGEGGAENVSVFGTIVLGEGAYGVTEVSGGGLQTIVKQKGSAGTADPLDQRSSVGWKALETAEILNQNYMVRIESVSSVFSSAAAN